MRKLLVTLVVLLALAVGVDRGAAWAAGHEIAKKVQSSPAVTGRPDATVHGFPFLTQFASGRYDDVEIDVTGLHRGRLNVAKLVAHLHGVHITPGEIVHRDVSTIPIDAVDADAVVTYSALTAALNRPGLTLGPGPGGRLRVTGTVDVAGRQVTGSADTSAAVRNGELVVVAQDVTVNGAAPPAAVARALGAALSFRIGLPSLPFQVTLDGVAARSDGLHLAASARNVTVNVS